jgi:hypothetical protein
MALGRTEARNRRLSMNFMMNGSDKERKQAAAYGIGFVLVSSGVALEVNLY